MKYNLLKRITIIFLLLSVALSGLLLFNSKVAFASDGFTYEKIFALSPAELTALYNPQRVCRGEKYTAVNEDSRKITVFDNLTGEKKAEFTSSKTLGQVKCFGKDEFLFVQEGSIYRLYFDGDVLKDEFLKDEEGKPFGLNFDYNGKYLIVCSEMLVKTYTLDGINASIVGETLASALNSPVAVNDKNEFYYLSSENTLKVHTLDGTEKVIYLTFDCGYENGYTATMLDTLKAHDAKACFFVVGNYLETAPELVKRMADEGHTVGNHTWHHYDMSHISDPETFTRELSSVAEKYEQLVGRPMEKFYRPPQGIFSEENLRTAQQLGYKTVFWSLAYVDWYQDDQPTHEQAFSKLLGRIHPGAVVLLHSTSRTNAEILDELLTKWEQDGYRFAPISELFSGDAHKEGARA